jgi:LPXTG-site transpeptidase (sortase) family protein
MKNNRLRILWFSSAALIAASVLILSLIYLPLMESEGRYYFSDKGKGAVVENNNNDDDPGNKKVIRPVDDQFGIVIPKISANAKVIADVDPNDSKVYQKALTEGVAQASGSALPDEPGNVFLFSHSGQDFLEANRYNAVFYLLGKMEVGDEIFIFYQTQKMSYKVREKKVVAATDVQYMAKESQKNTLTLMTCWPAGTTWKRLIVIAEKNK